jgi:hypothetical protein
MKVEAQLGNPLQQRSANGAGQSAISFAEVLASGRSANGIRAERAFGFAETGLLGAARFRSTSGSGNTLPPPSNNQLSHAQQGQMSNARPTLGKQAQIQQSRATGRSASDGGVHKATAASTGVQTVLPKDAAFSQSTPSFQVSSKRLDRSASKAAFFYPVARPRPDERRRKLTLQGKDDGLCINIRLEKDEEAGGDYLLSRFYPICRQFGVTLNAVQLFGVDKESVFSMNGDKQCK